MKKSQQISEEQKMTMMRLHYATWFSYAGLTKEAKLLGSNQNITRESIDKFGVIENILNENYIFFKLGRSLLTETLPFEQQAFSSNVQFGISESIVRILCGESNVVQPEFTTQHLEKYEVYVDGTAVKFG